MISAVARRGAVTCPGDATDPTARSGAPYEVLTGLHALGIDVLPVDVRGSEHLGRAAALAMLPLHQRGVSGPLRTRAQRGYSSALIAGPLSRWRSAVGSARLRLLRDVPSCNCGPGARRRGGHP